jgi:hypothetical protein
MCILFSLIAKTKKRRNKKISNFVTFAAAEAAGAVTVIILFLTLFDALPVLERKKNLFCDRKT